MAPLGYPKSNSKLSLPKLTGLAWAPGNWEAGLSRNWLSVNVADPPPHTHTPPTLGGQGTCVKAPKSPLYPPLTASGAPSRVSSQGQWLTPTEGFKEASGLGHIPQLPSGQDSHSCGYWGPRMDQGEEGSLPLLPLPASHWTYISGTEPRSHCPPDLETAQGARDSPPQIRKGKRGWPLGIFWPCLSLSCLPLRPFTLPSLSV